MTRRALGLAAVVLSASFAWLVLDFETPTGCDFRVDLAALRAEGARVAGARPTELRFERIVTAELPQVALGTKLGWGVAALPVHAYQLVFPDQTVIIDAAMTAEQARQSRTRDYDEAAWQRLSLAMNAASAIVVTHEHADHLGGLAARLGEGALVSTALLTRAQLEHPDRLAPATISPEVRRQLQPFEVGAVRAIAPGVVLLSAPGHTPGSQMVFVELANGAEVLLTGDTAWQRANIDQARGPPRFVTALGLHNDRRANACQLLALREVAKAFPALQLIPGHDASVMERLVAAGVLVHGFQ